MLRLRLKSALAVLALSAIPAFGAFGPEVWIDPAGSSTTATGAITDPFGGSGTAFDVNMATLCAGSSGSPTYPNVVIHIKAGTVTTTGCAFNGTPTWQLRSGQRLVGEGIDRTIIRRSNPNNDLYYVIFTAVGEQNVEISNVTVDANYWASTDPNISCGGVDFQQVGRARSVKITGTSGNTHAYNSLTGFYGDYELFSLRMSGTLMNGQPDTTATGGVIEDCEISNVKAGYISGITANAGQITVRNNRVYFPHWTTSASSNPSSSRATFCINTGDGVNSIFEGNVTAGGYTGLYSDTGVLNGVNIANNRFDDCIRGIAVYRTAAAQVDTVDIHDNIVSLSTDNTVTDNRYGIMLYEDDGSRGHIARAMVHSNVIKGGVSDTTTWGLYLSALSYAKCYENVIHFVSRPSFEQAYFDSDYGLFYNIWGSQNSAINSKAWITPASSDALLMQTITSSDPSSTYSVQPGDKFIGVQKSNYTVILPNAASFAGKEYVIVNETGSTLTGSAMTSAGGTINGSTSVGIASPYSSVRVISNGFDWIKF